MSKFSTIIAELFPFGKPQVCSWYEQKEMISILNKIGSIKSSNHLFYPNGGGLDLESAQKSFEENCIEITTARDEIISPLKLVFHSFENDIENNWSYFRLDLNPLTQTNIYENKIEYMESLTELSALNYIDRKYWDDGEYEDEKLPKSSRVILRWLKGSIVIFGKSSYYNKHNRTYDGRHNKLTDSDFRKYIQNVIDNGWQE